MLKEKMLSISIFCLAIAIIISSIVITKGVKSNGEYVRAGLADIGSGLNNIGGSSNQNKHNEEIPKDNYSLNEAAMYLRITEDKLVQLVDNKASSIPYVKIGSNYIFNKAALDKWLETAKIKM